MFSYLLRFGGPFLAERSVCYTVPHSSQVMEAPIYFLFSIEESREDFTYEDFYLIGPTAYSFQISKNRINLEHIVYKSRLQPNS